MQQNDREFLSVFAFVDDGRGKKKAIDCGYAYRDGDKMRVKMKATPTGAWDGSLTIERREPRQPGSYSGGGGGGGAQRQPAQRSSAPSQEDDVPF